MSTATQTAVANAGVSMPVCPVCKKPAANIMDGALMLSDGGPCMACVRARHQAVLKRRCVCKKADKQPSEVHQMGSRRWISCNRCLGQIQQLS